MSIILAILAQLPLAGILSAALTEAAKRIDALPVDKSNARTVAFLLTALGTLAMAYANGQLAANVDLMVQVGTVLVTLVVNVLAATGIYHLAKKPAA